MNGKLNVKRTILVGFAFFLISAFWQSYDKIVPLILTQRFGMNQTVSGIIMSLDNVFAVFMLPIFGALSDKVSTKYGRRTPFILLGTVIAVVFYVFLSIAPSLWLFILLLLATLISMATFRSPAVALMPDVTEKPLRSKGNAVINLMGTAGGISVLAVGLVIKTGEAHAENYPLYVATVCVIMIAALTVFLLTVKEVPWAQEADARNRALEASAPAKESASETVIKHKLSKEEFFSLCLILASVALWFTGYNAVTSKFSVYVEAVLPPRDAVTGAVLGDPVVSYDLALIIAQIAAIIAYIPVGLIASRIGRKKSILAGIVMLSVAFGFAGLINASTPPIPMYLLFALAGIGWATINVNSFPMVVELATGSDVGKYTGYYYTASMSAQIITPILSGFLVDKLGWGIFFPYAAIFAALSFVTMLFVKHGDAKAEKKGSLLEHLDTDD